MWESSPSLGGGLACVNAPGEAIEYALYRGKQRDDYETQQMSNRIDYSKFTHQFVNDESRIEAKACGHCGARVYLEAWDEKVGSVVGAAAPGPSGAARLPSFGGGAVPALPVATVASSSPSAKKARLATEVVKALAEAKALMDAGCIGSGDFDKLKGKLLKEM